MIPLEVRASADAVCDVVRFAAEVGNLPNVLPDCTVHLGLALMVCLRQLQLESALAELESV